MSFAKTRNLALAAVGIGGLIAGVLPKVFAEGTHFRIPFLQNPIIYDVRIRPHIMSSFMSTRDLQVVNISLRVLCCPEKAKLPEIYRTLGIDFDSRVLPSIGNEVLKSIVAQYNADQLVTKRDKVSKEIRESLTKRAMEYGIDVSDVSITHLSFSQDFVNAIEAKQVAQQDAERSKFIVLKSEQEKAANVIRAEGESESARLINEALVESGPGLVEIRRIETATDIANTLSHGRNVTYLPSNNNMLLNVPTS